MVGGGGVIAYDEEEEGGQASSRCHDIRFPQRGMHQPSMERTPALLNHFISLAVQVCCCKSFPTRVTINLSSLLSASSPRL